MKIPIALAFLFMPIAASSADTGEKVDFAREILPILSNKCFVCHGPDAKEKELRLDSWEGATVDLGGYKAIDPDKLGESEIIGRIHDEEDPMPPKKAERQLTPSERDLLTRWVKQGGEYAIHWAFVPPARKGHTSDPGTIDKHVSAGHAEAKVDFAQEADRATLARRAALVLTGLPPEPAEVAKFVTDDRPNAYAEFVDALMEKPVYGEHQARYWLDAVRYGDTHGLHLDNKRGIFPYRDWVIYAMNRNLPLDDFITWQFAGDLLPDPTLEQLVATGYVRMNPSTSEGGAIPAEFQAKNNFDRVETLGTVFLGMSLNCVRCHTHKYDPIPHTEYYNLMAFFNSTAEGSMDGNKYEYKPVVKAPPNLDSWHEWGTLAAKREILLTRHELGLKGDAKKVWDGLDWRQRLENIGTDAAKRMLGKFSELEKSYTTTLVAKDLDKRRVTKVLMRGEYHSPMGDPVEPGVISVAGKLSDDAERTRLGLAKWLTSDRNPLVARVLVNRIWQRTFGDGLVRTPEDFGLQGEQPTHPELLDWLAVELQESGWDLKHMLRLMVNSRTFKQESRWRKAVDDPENRLLARGSSYRLDAEVLRDIALWSSRLLNSSMGGEGVKPYQPGGLWKALMHPGSNTKDYKMDEDDRVYRRSLYVYWKRTSPHPMMTLFDAPSRETSCVRRSRSNTALQSLGLLNESQRVETARKLAERLMAEAGDDGARLDLLFQLLGSRDASELERAACGGLLKQMRERYAGAKEDAIAFFVRGEGEAG